MFTRPKMLSILIEACPYFVAPLWTQKKENTNRFFPAAAVIKGVFYPARGTGEERDRANYLINALFWQKQTFGLCPSRWAMEFCIGRPRPCCWQTELCVSAIEFGISLATWPLDLAEQCQWQFKIVFGTKNQWISRYSALITGLSYLLFPTLTGAH